LAIESLEVISGPEHEATEEAPYFSLLSFWEFSETSSFLLAREDSAFERCSHVRLCLNTSASLLPGISVLQISQKIPPDIVHGSAVVDS
jgi:hypothetical protein